MTIQDLNKLGLNDKTWLWRFQDLNGDMEFYRELAEAQRAGLKSYRGYRSAKTAATKAGYSDVKNFRSDLAKAKKAGYKTIKGYEKAKAKAESAGYKNIKEYKKAKRREAYKRRKEKNNLFRDRARRVLQRLWGQLSYDDSLYDDLLDVIGKLVHDKGDSENITASEVIEAMNTYLDVQNKKEEKFKSFPNVDENFRKL